VHCVLGTVGKPLATKGADGLCFVAFGFMVKKLWISELFLVSKN